MQNSDQTMTCFRRFLWMLVLIALAPGAQGALRCGTYLVDNDAWPIEVEERCGPPDYVVEYPTATVPGLGVVQTEMHWYYNPGPQRFIRRLTFRNGKLAQVESLGYGFHVSDRASCNISTLRHARTEYELIARCGEPVSKRVEWRTPKPTRRLETWRGIRPVLVQLWLYDLAGNQFRQVVTLRNGQVVDIESRSSR
ncbi:DUF2845 domain-containing protein [Marinobacter apostichopi]|uniref:DUF2845 domain-containing protein n=1 Tax=Marinobacter apostichopi TaxID=3035454 RepID=UPI002573ABD5|nr:DUF2845 domain-containing protein [Marinobacter sp. LA51]